MLFFRGVSQDWIKFVNMLMNDTTFLLDESMDTLKSIRELQDLMENKTEWPKLNRVCPYWIFPGGELSRQLGNLGIGATRLVKEYFYVWSRQGAKMALAARSSPKVPSKLGQVLSILS